MELSPFVDDDNNRFAYKCACCGQEYTYGDTLSLKTQAVESGPDTIPDVEVTEEGHALAVDQQNGISLEEALRKVDEIMRVAHGGTSD